METPGEGLKDFSQFVSWFVLYPGSNCQESGKAAVRKKKKKGEKIKIEARSSRVPGSNKTDQVDYKVGVSQRCPLRCGTQSSSPFRFSGSFLPPPRGFLSWSLQLLPLCSRRNNCGRRNSGGFRRIRCRTGIQILGRKTEERIIVATFAIFGDY